MPLVKVKVDFVGLNPSVHSRLQNVSLVNKFVSKSSIENIVMYFQDLLAEEIGYELIYSDVFMLDKSVKDDLQKSLNDFGVNAGGLLIRIQCRKDQISTEAETSQPIVNKEIEQDQQNEHKEASINEDNSTTAGKDPFVEIFKPNPQTVNPLASRLEYDSEEESRPSIDDLKRYQKLLKDQANVKTDYVTNKLKQEKEKSLQHQPSNPSKDDGLQREVSIRIKFPDLTVTNIKLPVLQRNNKTTLVKDFIQFLNNNLLISSSLKYNLIIPHFNSNSLNKGKISQDKLTSSGSSASPTSIYYSDILNDGDILQTNLIHYNLVNFLFEIIKPDDSISDNRLNYKIDSLNKGPFVKNLKSAQPINKLIDDALSTESGNRLSLLKNHKFSKSETDSEHSAINLQKEDVSNKEKKVPKWFKLIKK